MLTHIQRRLSPPVFDGVHVALTARDGPQARGQHEDRLLVALRTQLTAYAEPVAAGQHDVEDKAAVFDGASSMWIKCDAANSKPRRSPRAQS